MEGCVPDYFLARSNDFLEFQLVDWQPHRDDMIPGFIFLLYLERVWVGIPPVFPLTSS